MYRVSHVIRSTFRAFLPIIAGFLFLLIIGIFTDNSEGEVIIVDDDGDAEYELISEAVYYAHAGDMILVREGYYPESVDIDKEITITGAGSENTTLDADGENYGFNILEEKVHLSGFTIINGNAGILIQAGECMIFENNCTDNFDGMIEFYSFNNRITDNTFYFNTQDGLSIQYSSNTLIERNLCLNNGGDGISLWSSQGCYISRNTCDGNSDSGIMLDDSGSNNITNNVISSNAQGISLISANSNEINSNLIRDNIMGMDLSLQSSSNMIQSNSIQGNSLGMSAAFNDGRSVSALHNWWGDPSGPYHALRNPKGNGENITDLVEFDPWLLSDPYDNEKPKAVIDSISPSSAEEGDPVEFHGHGTDDGYLTRYCWCSDLYGEFHNGTSGYCETSSLPAGDHIITFMVEDDQGVWSTPVTANLRIRDPSNENSPPELHISYPGETEIITGIVVIEGTVIDPDDDEITVEISIDGNDWIKFSSNTSWSYTLDTTGMMNGVVSIELRCSDGTDYSAPKYIDLIIENPVDADVNEEDDSSGIPLPGSSFVAFGIVGIGMVGLIGLGFYRQDSRFAFFSIFIAPLYSRLNKNELLDQKNRSDIYTYIVENPGVNYTRLLNDLQLGNGTLVHHLSILERERYIRSQNLVGRKVFFPKQSGWTHSNDARNLPLSKRQRNMLEFLAYHGPATMRELEFELSLKQPAVSYNIRKLMELELVSAIGGKRNARYHLNEGVELGDGPAA